MLNKENREKCRQLLEHYGVLPQLHMQIEECGELIVAICKLFRGGPVADVKGEMADVYVMLEQLCEMYGISQEEIDEIATAKLDRKSSSKKKRPLREQTATADGEKAL